MLLIITVVLLLNIILIVLVNTSFVQTRIVEKITDWLAGKTGTEVSIGRVDIDLFTGLSIDDIYVEDLSGDTLLYAKRLSANASALTAYHSGELHLMKVGLSDFKVYLSKDSADAPFNFQFLMDAFASADTTAKDTTPSDFDLSIGKINLLNGSFRYDIKSDTLTPHLFNPSHIHVDSLMAQFRLKSIKMEKLEAGVDMLSFREWSGLRLDDLSVQVSTKDSVIASNLLELRLPNTDIQIADISVDLRKKAMDSHIMGGMVAGLQIVPSHICPSDFSPFVPQLAQLHDTLGISGALSVDLPKATISGLNLFYGDGLLCSLDAEADDVCHPEGTHLDLSLKNLFASVPAVESLLHSLSPTTEMPEIIDKIGQVEISLFAQGILDDMKFDMDLNTLLGEIRAEGSAGFDHLSGDVHANVDLESNELAMAALLDTSVGLGNVALRLQTQLSLPKEGLPEVSLSGHLPLVTFKEYPYRDINLNARYFGHNSVELDLVLPDTNINLSMKGRVLNIATDSMDCDLWTSLNHFSPYNLHLAKEDMRSFMMNTRLSLRSHGNSLDNLTCRLSLDSTYMQTDTMDVTVENLLLTVTTESNKTHRIDLVAPYFTVFIDGKYDFATLPACFTNMMHPYLPTFFAQSETMVDSTKNDFTFGVEVLNSVRLSRVLNLPFLIDRPAFLSGHFCPATKGLALNGKISSVKFGNTAITNADIHVAQEENMYVLDFTTKLGDEKQEYPLNLKLHTEADHDVVLFSLQYDNSPCTFKLQGNLLSMLSFPKEEGEEFFIRMNVMPTDLVLNNLSMEVEPAVIELRHKNISVADLGFSMDDQPFLMVNGQISESKDDSLLVQFSHASVHHLLSSVNKQDIPVDAFLDGTVHFYSLLGSPRFYTKGFHVDDITYRGDTIGSLNVNSRWNTKYQGMRVVANLQRGATTAATADGYLSPVNDKIHFDVHLDELPLVMAEVPLQGVLHNLSGSIGTDMQVNGKLSAPDIEGYFYFKDARATVDFTDVAYRISDTIFFSPNRIMFRDFDIYDSKNKKLNINCAVHHKDFSDFRYTATLRMDNLLLLNNPTKKDSLLYGTFYASGAVDVKGDMKAARISGSLKNGDWTNVMIRLPESVTQVQTYDNIIYVTSAPNDSTQKKIPEKKKEQNFSIDADVSVELTDDALFGAIISPTTGDAISFRGAGNINAKYNSETSSTKLFGQYVINDGTLKLKLSQLPVKTFSIKEDSKVYFNGDPTACSIDITAGYRVRADLALLDPSFSSMGLPSTRVPVECDLNISGNLKKFDIKYDISLPEANEDLSRTVNSVITTDDIRIREFAYLLGFGMFYPPSGQAEGNSSIVSSLASSSLSGALNGALSGILGDRVTIGTDLSSSQEDLSDLEMNVSVSTNFFNNRLVLNSSLGYKNNNTATEAEATDNALISNFDAEYKLTKSGMFRLKAYNHANNEFYNSSSTTQGLGVVFVKEAKNFNGLFDLRPKNAHSSTMLRDPMFFQQDSAMVKLDSTNAHHKEAAKKERSGNE